MTKKARTLMFILLFCFASLILAVTQAQDKVIDDEKLPTGDWTLSIGVYTGAGHKSLPVDVSSVTSDALKGSAVTKVTLENRTSQYVEQVKFRWQISEEEDPSTTLLQGTTPRVDVQLSPGVERTLEYTVVTFAKIYKPLLREGVLKGKYRMEIMVGEVVYLDGSIWEWEELSDTAHTILHVFGASQELQDRVIKKISWRNEPIKIIAIKANGVPIKLGETFSGDDEWLKDLTISVVNTSSKNIVFIEINLEFPIPENQPKEPPASYSISYGCAPQPEAPAQATQPKPTSPGETISIVLPDYRDLKEFLKLTGYPASIKQVKIIIGDVVFDDGTKWSAGGLFRRDPNNLNGWQRVREVDNNSFGRDNSRDRPNKEQNMRS